MWNQLSGFVRRDSPIDDPIRYWRIRKIGSGATSVVYEVRDRNTGQRLAAKIFKKGNVMDQAATHEAELLREMSHPNVINLVTSFKTMGRMWMVMPRMSLTLKEHIINKRKRGGSMGLYEVKKIAFQMARGLNYLRFAQIIHGDIKLGNTLIDNNGKIVLSDFGLARTLEEGQRVSQTLYTVDYRPPEVALGAKFDYSAEVWAVGICFASMATGRIVVKCNKKAKNHDRDLLSGIFALIGRPSDEDLANIGVSPEKIYAKQFAKALDTILMNIDAGLKAIIKSMLGYRPDLRPTPAQLLQSNWFDSIRSDPHCALVTGELQGEATFSTSTF